MKEPLRGRPWFALVACAFLLLATSCGEDGVLQPGPSSPESAQIDSSQPAPQNLPYHDGLPSPNAEAPPYPIEICTPVTPAAGGLVSIGRYSVLIPPGALATTTVVNIVVREEEGFVSCELLPHGTTFLAPVILQMDLRGTEFADDNALTIYWLDESADRWVDLGATADAVSSSVWVQLNHFSRYAAGRAGW